MLLQNWALWIAGTMFFGTVLPPPIPSAAHHQAMYVAHPRSLEDFESLWLANATALKVLQHPPAML